MIKWLRNLLLKVGLLSTPLVALSVVSPVAATMILSGISMVFSVAKMIISTLLPIVTPIITTIAGNLAFQLAHYLSVGLTAFTQLSLLSQLSLGIFGGLLLLNEIVLRTPRPHPKTMDLSKAYLEGDVETVEELTGKHLAPMEMPLYNQVKRRKPEKEKLHKEHKKETEITAPKRHKHRHRHHELP